MVHKARGAYNIESNQFKISHILMKGSSVVTSCLGTFFFVSPFFFLEHQGDTRNFSRIAVGVRREGGLVWTVYLVTFVIA